MSVEDLVAAMPFDGQTDGPAEEDPLAAARGIIYAVGASTILWSAVVLVIARS